MSTNHQMAESAAAATRAAKAAFVSASPEGLRSLIASQTGIDDVEISEFQLLTEGAGASNGIVLFTVDYRADGRPIHRDLVLRYMPGVQLLRQKSYADEFATLQAVERAGLPAPSPLWLDADGTHLGFPGYVMERVEGRSPDAAMFASGLLAEAAPPERYSMMLEAVAFQGRLRRTAIGPLDVPHLVERGEGVTAVGRELTWWLTEARLAAAEHNPKLSFLEELRRWMISNEPSLRTPTLVHGDAQFANFMFANGRIAAVVDWELSYLGHNEADLALMLHLSESHQAQAADLDGIPTITEYIDAYQDAAGGEVEHLDYFRVFNLVKVLSIYLMLGDKMPNLDPVWDYHVELVHDAQRRAAKAAG